MGNRYAFLILSALLLWTTHGVAEEYKNYQLIVDGKTYEINLKEKVEVKGKKGQKVTVQLKKKPFIQFTDRYVSFLHKSDMSVSSQNLGDGVTQITAMLASGTMFMIQEYSDMDPSMMAPLLLNEMTKESVDYGYKMVQKKFERKLNSGVTLKGLRATLTYKNEVSTMEVMTIGKKDSGVVVVTSIDKEMFATDKAFLDKFLETLKIKL